MWQTGALVFEYTTLLILSVPILIKSVLTMRNLCKKGLRSEQSVVFGVLILIIAQAFESINYLISTESITFISNIVFYKVFLLARIVFTSLVCWLLLLNFDTYKHVRRINPNQFNK